MKIRIKGASVRMRLSRSEVAKLVTDGLVQEETPFGNSVFRYALAKVATGAELSAAFEDGRITMYVPEALIRDWDTNDVVSIEAHMPVAGSGSLYLLLEKDFQCIDQTTEDQSDNYINPNKSC